MRLFLRPDCLEYTEWAVEQIFTHFTSYHFNDEMGRIACSILDILVEEPNFYLMHPEHILKDYISEAEPYCQPVALEDASRFVKADDVINQVRAINNAVVLVSISTLANRVEFEISIAPTYVLDLYHRRLIIDELLNSL